MLGADRTLYFCVDCQLIYHHLRTNLLPQALPISSPPPPSTFCPSPFLSLSFSIHPSSLSLSLSLSKPLSLRDKVQSVSQSLSLSPSLSLSLSPSLSPSFFLSLLLSFQPSFSSHSSFSLSSSKMSDHIYIRNMVSDFPVFLPVFFLVGMSLKTR